MAPAWMLGVLAVAAIAAAPQWSAQASGVEATLRGVSVVSDTVAWASGSGSTVLGPRCRLPHCRRRFPVKAHSPRAGRTSRCTALAMPGS